MHGLPASYIQVAGRDPYRDEGLQYAQRLEEEGVLVRVRMYVFLVRVLTDIYMKND